MNICYTYLLTALVPLISGGNSFILSRNEKGRFFSKEYTDVLKGLCCLIVFYVHVKPERGNTLQDAIGSFAYIAVTFFFLVSAFGMMASVEKKQNYLKHFWRNRLVSLLIPCFLINIVGFLLGVLIKGHSNISTLYRINSYVVVLLQWCVLFYLVELCRFKWFPRKRFLADCILIVGVGLSSICQYLLFEAEIIKDAGWFSERIGLIWGVFLYRHYAKIVIWMESSRMIRIIILTLTGALMGISYLKFKMVFFWGEYLLKILLAFVLLLLLFTITSNRRFGDYISNWLGRISYEVYLSHGMMMSIISYILPKDFNSGLFILISVIITLALSTCVHAVGIPIVNLLRK